jgi:hypothetical protein
MNRYLRASCWGARLCTLIYFMVRNFCRRIWEYSVVMPASIRNSMWCDLDPLYPFLFKLIFCPLRGREDAHFNMGTLLILQSDPLLYLKERSIMSTYTGHSFFFSICISFKYKETCLKFPCGLNFYLACSYTWAFLFMPQHSGIWKGLCITKVLVSDNQFGA